MKQDDFVPIAELSAKNVTKIPKYMSMFLRNFLFLGRNRNINILWEDFAKRKALYVATKSIFYGFCSVSVLFHLLGFSLSLDSVTYPFIFSFIYNLIHQVIIHPKKMYRTETQLSFKTVKTQEGWKQMKPFYSLQNNVHIFVCTDIYTKKKVFRTNSEIKTIKTMKTFDPIS